jgi:hypothetical protein
MTGIHRSALSAVLVAVALLSFACQGGGGGATRSVTLRELNDTGVKGTATLTDLGKSRTRVEVVVQPAGHPDMPAHIHPGSCDDLTPQPRYPLENVRGGRSVTDVPASLEELTRGDVAINLHVSNSDMGTYSACGEIR